MHRLVQFAQWKKTLQFHSTKTAVHLSSFDAPEDGLCTPLLQNLCSCDLVQESQGTTPSPPTCESTWAGVMTTFMSLAVLLPDALFGSPGIYASIGFFEDFSSFRCFVLICTGILCFSFPLILQDGECSDIGSENMHWIWSHILAICFRKPLEQVEHAVGTCWKHVFRGWKYGSWTWPHFGNEPRAAETRWARCFLWPLDKIA